MFVGLVTMEMQPFFKTYDRSICVELCVQLI